MENRHKLTGTVVYIGTPRMVTQYLHKCDFKLRFSDIDFANKVQERIVKFELINDNIPEIEKARIDDQIDVSFYVEGRDYTKDGKTMNFTTLVAYHVEILKSESRDTKEDRQAEITSQGRSYDNVKVEASDEQLAGVSQDPLLSLWDQKKDKYGLDYKDKKKEEVKNKSAAPETEQFNELIPNKNEPDDLPF